MTDADLAATLDRELAAAESPARLSTGPLPLHRLTDVHAVAYRGAGPLTVEALHAARYEFALRRLTPTTGRAGPQEWWALVRELHADHPGVIPLVEPDAVTCFGVRIERDPGLVGWVLQTAPEVRSW